MNNISNQVINKKERYKLLLKGRSKDVYMVFLHRWTTPFAVEKYIYKQKSGNIRQIVNTFIELGYLEKSKTVVPSTYEKTKVDTRKKKHNMGEIIGKDEIWGWKKSRYPKKYSYIANFNPFFEYLVKECDFDIKDTTKKGVIDGLRKLFNKHREIIFDIDRYKDIFDFDKGKISPKDVSVYGYINLTLFALLYSIDKTMREKNHKEDKDITKLLNNLSNIIRHIYGREFIKKEINNINFDVGFIPKLDKGAQLIYDYFYWLGHDQIPQTRSKNTVEMSLFSSGLPVLMPRAEVRDKLDKEFGFEFKEPEIKLDAPLQTAYISLLENGINTFR